LRSPWKRLAVALPPVVTLEAALRSPCRRWSSWKRLVVALPPVIALEALVYQERVGIPTPPDIQ